MENLKLYFNEFLNRLKAVDIGGSAAEITYYLILSIFPFFIALLNLINFTPLKDEGVTEELFETLPTEISGIISGLVGDILKGSNNILFAVSIIAGVYASSKGVSALIKAINKVYFVKENRKWYKAKFLAFIMTFVLLLIILISLVGIVFGDIITAQVINFFDLPLNTATISKILRIGIVGGFLVLCFSLLYKYSPHLPYGKKIKMMNALPGAIFTTIAWFLSSMLFSFYVNNFANYSKTYGSLGGIIALLVWLDFTALIIILGAIVNASFIRNSNI